MDIKGFALGLVVVIFKPGYATFKKALPCYLCSAYWGQEISYLFRYVQMWIGGWGLACGIAMRWWWKWILNST